MKTTIGVSIGTPKRDEGLGVAVVAGWLSNELDGQIYLWRKTHVVLPDQWMVVRSPPITIIYDAHDNVRRLVGVDERGVICDDGTVLREVVE